MGVKSPSPYLTSALVVHSQDGLTLRPGQGSAASSSQSLTNIIAHPVPQRHRPPLILTMANRGYDAVVDVDTEVRTLPSRPQTATLTKGFQREIWVILTCKTTISNFTPQVCPAWLPDTDWCSFLMSTTYSRLRSKSVVTQDPT